jgi:lysophospholipase L1-like esterase
MEPVDDLGAYTAELSGGSPVAVDADALIATVTFGGVTGIAGGLPPRPVDFTVSPEGEITGVSVSGTAAAVTVRLSPNTDNISPKTYTIGINPESMVISGAATVTITQAGLRAMFLNEDFDTLDAWNSTLSGSNTIDIVADPDDPANKLLQIQRTVNSPVGIWNKDSANANGIFTVETRIKRSVSTHGDNSANVANQYQIYTYESSRFDISAGGASSANIVFDSGFIKTYLNASVAGTSTDANTNVILRRYTANTWYKIVMRIDTEADTFDFYVDGVKHASDALRTAVDTIGTFSIAGTSGDGYIGYLWVDYLRVYEGEPLFSGDDGTNDNGELIPVVPLEDPAVVPVVQTVTGSNWWQERYNNWINNRITGQKIIFIGDSITEQWGGEWAGVGSAVWTQLRQDYSNRITNRGFGGDETQNVIWRLKNGEFPPGLNAEYAVVLIGTNNRHGPRSTAAGIGEIIKTIRANGPLTKIILLAIFPRGTGNNDPNRLRNEAVNEIIKRYDGYLGTTYIDLGQYFVNPDGSLKSGLFVDKLHLTAAGYTLWRQRLLEIIQP